MVHSTHKRAYVLHRQLGLLPGFLDGNGVGAPPPATTLLSPQGQALEIAPEHLLAVFYVPRFLSGPADPVAWTAHRPGPRQPGLWLRARLREARPDCRSLEGVLASDLLALDAGLTMTPLYLDSPWQRLWIPRGALDGLTPVEVVRPARRRRASPDAGQPGLFRREEVS